MDFNGEERDENRFLAGPVTSEAKERIEERPGTVFMGEDEDVLPLEPPIAVLYCRGELNILRPAFGDVGGVIPIDDLSRSALPPPETVRGELLADNDTSPFIDIESVELFAGEARGLGLTWLGYWTCCTTVFIGEEMDL